MKSPEATSADGRLALRLVANGGLTVSLAVLYTLLRSGALLRGPYAYTTADVRGALGYAAEVPEVAYCPSDEPVRVHVNEVLSDLCAEVYKYFDGRCAACVIKVYSVAYEEWLVEEATLMRLLEAIARHRLPSEFRNGSIVVTTCPTSYEEALRLSPDAYVDGIERLRCLAREVKLITLPETP